MQQGESVSENQVRMSVFCQHFAVSIVVAPSSSFFRPFVRSVCVFFVSALFLLRLCVPSASCAKVAAVVGEFPGIEEANVYGVHVPGASMWGWGCCWDDLLIAIHEYGNSVLLTRHVHSHWHLALVLIWRLLLLRFPHCLPLAAFFGLLQCRRR